MARSLKLNVVTPERKLIDELPVTSLVAPSAGGYVGILPGHAPLVAGLKIGVVKFRTAERPNEFEVMAVSGGFLEVSGDQATILAEAAERAADIDVMRARQAKERAEAALREKRDLTDAARAELALKRAINRLRVAGQTQGVEPQ